MAAEQVRRDFDTLSAVYDETREPLDLATIQGLEGYLGEHHWSTILEVGVGTGRVARPLVDRGVRVVGVDASRGMLGRAAAKGLPYLVRGDAYCLPFPDRSFDAALFVHVLHILDRPSLGLREAARVGRHGVLAILDLPSKEARGGDPPPEEEPRRLVREALSEAGYPDLLRAGPRAKEQKLLRTYPPAELRVLSDREVTEPLARRLDLIEKRAYRHVLRVPPDVLARAVAAARERVGTRTVTYRRTEAVAWWNGPPGSLVPSP
jgi:ubiquinone/menaquinone biosynthesis C-methylase UbiE